MKQNKKTMFIIAVTLLLAAALFVGAGAAEAENKYWHDETVGGTAEPVTDYTLVYDTDGNFTGEVQVHTAKGLGWVANQLILHTDDTLAKTKGITVVFDAQTYDMAAHLWLPLSTHKIIVTADEEGRGTATAGASIPAMDGITFKSEDGAAIQNLRIINTLLYSGSDDTGGNNNYGSGFIGRIFNVSPVSFENLTFQNTDVSPDSTYGLNPDLYDPKGYNHIGAIIGYAGYTHVTFKNVTVTGSKINGSSKVGSFIGYATDCHVTFEDGCKVGGKTTITGFDGVGKLIGFADTRDPVVGTDTEIGSDVEVVTAIWPASSESYLDREVLGYIDTDDEIHELWMQKDGVWVLNPQQIPADGTVVDVIKGSSYDKVKEEFTGASIRAAKADLYTRMGNYGTKTFTIYGERVEAPVQSIPANYVAAIGDKKYTSLADAVAAVPDGTLTTITMIADHTIFGNAGVTVPAEKNIILELNGCTILGNATEIGTSAVIRNEGTLIIADSTAASTGVGYGLIVNGFIAPATPDYTQTPGYASNVITNCGTLTMLSGAILNVGDGSACYALDANSTLRSVYTLISGGELIAEKTAVRMFCNSSANGNNMIVSGGLISSESGYGLIFQSSNANPNKGSLDIGGGTFSTSRPDYPLDVYVYAPENGDTTKMRVTITNGTFNDTVAFSESITSGVAVSGGHFNCIESYGSALTKFITGGIIETKPDETYIAESYKWDSDTHAVSKVETPKEDGTVEPENPQVPGAPEGTEVDKIENLPTSGDVIIKNVTFSASSEPSDRKSVEETVVSIDVNLYIMKDEGIEKYHGTLKSPAIVTFTIAVDKDYDTNKLAVHHKMNGSWVKVEGAKFTTIGPGKIKVTFPTSSFSPFAIVVETPVKKSSHSSQGSSVWLTETQAPGPTVTPTPTAEPTQVPTQVPTVKPITTQTPAGKSPMPIMGILAGLGCAAALFGLRRK